MIIKSEVKGPLEAHHDVGVALLEEEPSAVVHYIKDPYDSSNENNGKKSL